jgi:hypothetical protein
MPRRKKDSANGEIAPSKGAGNGSAEPPVASPKKKSAPRPKVAAEKKASKHPDAAAPQITDEAIRTRAYFIAEERARRGLPGDEQSDWQEARRQLIAELG